MRRSRLFADSVMSTGSSGSSASSQESSVEALLEERAQQLFLVGDQERKGFIVKRDMQRMRSEIPMSPEQLEAVFESLDAEHNGYLTIEQFLSGFGTFVRSETELSCGGSEARNLLQQIEATNLLHSCMDILRQLCEILQLSTNMPLLEQFLRQLLEDLVRIHDEQHVLEEALRTKDEEHELRVQGLFEEMEAQLSEEKEKQILQSEQIIRQRTKVLENQLAEKEQSLQEALRVQQDLSNRLHTLHLQTREENERFLQAKEEAEVQLELERQEMSHKIKKWHQEMENERLNNLAKGFQLGKRITTEHHGLLKQLQLLQEMASVLEGRNEGDELHKHCHVDKCHWQKYPENIWTGSLGRMESDDFFQDPSHTHT